MVSVAMQSRICGKKVSYDEAHIAETARLIWALATAIIRRILASFWVIAHCFIYHKKLDGNHK